MPIELASREFVPKPWGSTNTGRWCNFDQKGERIGEVWFGLVDAAAPQPTLLLKLLFTQAPLSIQVHPGDAFAQSVGLANGKTEAWYVLAAEYESRVALGLKRRISAEDLRSSVIDGTIAELVDWRSTEAGEAILVPAGTIHAIGAGLTIAEVQQRSDTTYRLFDHGRQRELHIEKALAVADAGPPSRHSLPILLTQARTMLVKSPYFVLERLTLPKSSDWWLNTGCESWLLVIAGKVRVGSVEAGVGEAIYIDEDHAKIEAGPDGVNGLLAYARPEPIANLLERPHRAFERRASAIADYRAASASPVRSTVTPS